MKVVDVDVEKTLDTGWTYLEETCQHRFTTT